MMHRNHLVNRMELVDRLVAYLDARPVAWTAAMVEGLSASQRATIARAAGEKRTGSVETWEWVAQELARRERTVAA
jgi:hypothetical protein